MNQLGVWFVRNSNCTNEIFVWNVRNVGSKQNLFFCQIICDNFIFCKKKEVWKYQTILWQLYFVFMKWGWTRKLSSYQKTFPRYKGLIKVNYKGSLMQMLHYKRHLCTAKHSVNTHWHCKVIATQRCNGALYQLFAVDSWITWFNSSWDKHNKMTTNFT